MMLWLLMSLSWGVDDELLAPTMDALDRSMDRAELLLDAARDELDVLSDVQASWVAEGCVASKCWARVGSQLVLRARASGHQARDLVQSARVEAERARRLAEAATVRPLLDAAHEQRLLQVEGRADKLARAYLVRVSWYEQYMAGWAWRFRWSVRGQCLRDEDSP